MLRRSYFGAVSNHEHRLTLSISFIIVLYAKHIKNILLLSFPAHSSACESSVLIQPESRGRALTSIA